MNFIKNIVGKSIFSIAFLALVELILFLANYSEGTYLIGWDNVMPEFNFQANLQRSIFGVWQEHRGLGLLDGMSHIANLFHTLYMMLISSISGLQSARPIFIHLTHFIGGAAFFYLAHSITKNKKASLLGGLFYMFNLGVIQMYFAPLEAFSVHFAALPVICLFTIKSLENLNRKNLLFLFLATLLTTPQSFVPTFFIVLLIPFLSILAFYFFKTRKWKTAFIIFFVFLSANAFWLVPYSYSAINTNQTIQDTRINEFSSEEIYQRNKARGDILSVLSLKGFMIDTIEYDRNKKSDVYFMESWRKYSQSPLYILFYLPLLLLAFYGVWKSFKQKDKNILPYTLPLLISFFFLANNTSQIDELNNSIREHIPIFNEVFRFPFTKLIILFSFCLSLFISYGALFVINKAKKAQAILVFLFISILFLSYPSFRGNFFSPLLKSNIPGEYFEVFNYFKNVPLNQRIALLPTQSFWNWQYRSFGQFGSGFLWYGIEQPILERAFDPWSNYNEQFYNELSTSLRNKDRDRFNQTLEKYDIGYLLLDKYLMYPRIGKAIDYRELENFLQQNSMIEKIASFGKLNIYKTILKKTLFYNLNSQDTMKIYPNFRNELEDITYDFHPSNYVLDKNNPDIIPLLPSLYTGKLQEDLEFIFSDTGDSIFLSPKQMQSTQNSNLFLSAPSLFTNEFLIPIEIEVSVNREILLKPLYPRVSINNKKVDITEKPFVILPQIVKNPKKLVFHNFFNHEVNLNGNNKSYLINNIKNIITIQDGNERETVEIVAARTSPNLLIPLPRERIEMIEISIPKIQSPISTMQKFDYDSGLIAKGKQKELSFYLPDLFHQQPYVFLIKNEYKSGLPIQFYIDNPSEQRSELETRLSKTSKENIFILPKTEDYFKGYGLHFIAKSIGSNITESELKNIQLYPLPLETIKNLYLRNSDSKLNSKQEEQSSPKTSLSYKKINYSLYLLETDLSQNQYIVMSQSFDKDWKVYAIKDANWLTTHLPFIFGKEIKEHVLVNNWANGWTIDSNKLEVRGKKLVVIFWPQYLEYLGFAFVFGTIVFLLRYTKKV